MVNHMGGIRISVRYRFEHLRSRSCASSHERSATECADSLEVDRIELVHTLEDVEHFAAGISDIFHVDETAVRNPGAMVDIIKGALDQGMRDFTFNLADNEFVRITGYLVRKRDLAQIAGQHAVRHTSDQLAAGSENAYHLTERTVQRVGCHERTPR